MRSLVHDRILVLADPGGTAIALMGLTDTDEDHVGIIAKPSVFVIDDAGIIRYRYVGRSVSDRPTVPLLILAAESVAGPSDR